MREGSEERGEEGRRGWEGLQEKWLRLDIYVRLMERGHLSTL